MKGTLETLESINRTFEKSMPLFAPLGVTLGVFFPSIFLELKPYVPWVFGLITLAGALKLQARELVKAISSPMPLLFFFFSAHVLMPLIVFFVSSLVFPNDPDIVSGYVLLYSVPTAVTSSIWVSIYRGDLALCLTLILLDSVLAPVIVPGTVKLLLGTSISFNMTGIIISLIFMVAIPTIVGVTLNETSRGKIPALINPWLNPISKICIVLVVAPNAAAAAPKIHPENPLLWAVIIFCISFSALGFCCGKLTGLAGKFKKEKQITTMFIVGFRNTSAAMTLGTEFFPGSAALPAVLGIMFQQMIAGIMGRILLGKRSGDKAE